MLQHSGLSNDFWAEATSVAAHTLNHAPQKNLGWRTPYELLFGRVPEVSYLCIFSCHAWVYNDQRKKWDPKAKLMMLVGYERGSKAYRLWNPATRSIVVSANVRFDKREFPSRQKPVGPKVSPSTYRFPTPSKDTSPEMYVEIPWFTFDEGLKPTAPPISSPCQGHSTLSSQRV